MPGTFLNLDLPSLSDTMATIVSKTATALSAIQDDLTPAVTAAEINVNVPLEFNGQWANTVGGIIMQAGNSPTAAGSLYYSAGEFWLIDASGTIQITANGGLNLASAGGIGGDYGHGNSSLVSFSNGNSEYDFFDGTGTAYASVKADAVTLQDNSTLHTVAIKPSATPLSNYTIRLPSQTPSGLSFLMMDSSGNVTTQLTQSTEIFATGIYFEDQGTNRPFTGAPVAGTAAAGTQIVGYQANVPIGKTITAVQAVFSVATSAGNGTQIALATNALGNASSVISTTGTVTLNVSGSHVVSALSDTLMSASITKASGDATQVTIISVAVTYS